MPQQPQLEARIGDDCVNGGRRPAVPQNLVKLVVLIDVNDENCAVEIAASLGFAVLGKYS